MTIQGNSKIRSLPWDSAAAQKEVPFQRAERGVPSGGRVLPGMPLQMIDHDGDDDMPSGKMRFNQPRAPWWRPQTNLGRGLLAAGAFLVLGSIMAGAIMLKSYVTHDVRFQIAGADNIQSAGLRQVTADDVLPVFNGDIGHSIFFVPLEERRKQLEQIPWIQHATVMRVLPGQIRVSIVERQPVAFVRQGSQVGLVDADGVLLTMPAATMSEHHYSFPVVTGINPGDAADGRKSRMATYLRLLLELDANNQHLSEQISEIDLSNPEDARVLMPEQGSDILAHFGEDHFLDRYQRYKAHISEWKMKYPKLASVDLRYDQQVVLDTNQNGPDPKPAAAAPDATQTAANTPADVPTATAPAPTLQRAALTTTKHPAPAKPKKAAAKKIAAKKKAAPAKKNAKGSKNTASHKHPEPKKVSLAVQHKPAQHPAANHRQGE